MHGKPIFLSNMTQEELQMLLTSFQEEVGHIKEWEIDRNERARAAAAISSQARKGKSVPKTTTIAATKGRQKQAWELLLSRVSQEMIIEAIKVHVNHQNNIIKELDLSITTFRKLCKHYNISIPKKSNYEKTEWARTQQAKAVLCWKYDKSLDGGKGEFVGEYYSTGDAARQLGFNTPQRVILVCNKKRPHTHGYYFEYKPIV
jgi:hypothetical protein